MGDGLPGVLKAAFRNTRQRMGSTKPQRGPGRESREKRPKRTLVGGTSWVRRSGSIRPIRKVPLRRTTGAYRGWQETRIHSINKQDTKRWSGVPQLFLFRSSYLLLDPGGPPYSYTCTLCLPSPILLISEVKAWQWRYQDGWITLYKCPTEPLPGRCRLVIQLISTWAPIAQEELMGSEDT